MNSDSKEENSTHFYSLNFQAKTPPRNLIIKLEVDFLEPMSPAIYGSEYPTKVSLTLPKQNPIQSCTIKIL